ncbi:MAG: sigma-70 family RNA polymerase sigma factor [Ilumatobacteraceae bacterium]
MECVDGPAGMHELVDRALLRDSQAWRALVDRLKGVAWKVLYGYDLSEEDRKDAFASTFFRLYERLATIREPEKLPGWVATTARNEAHSIFRKRRRTVPMEEMELRDAPVVDHSERLIADELSAALHTAFLRLPPLSQQLMRLLSSDPPLGYDEISDLLDLPRGSIGPMRQRCLERLRRSPELAQYREAPRRETPQPETPQPETPDGDDGSRENR